MTVQSEVRERAYQDLSDSKRKKRTAGPSGDAAQNEEGAGSHEGTPDTGEDLDQAFGMMTLDGHGAQ